MTIPECRNSCFASPTTSRMPFTHNFPMHNSFKPCSWPPLSHLSISLFSIYQGTNKGGLKVRCAYLVILHHWTPLYLSGTVCEYFKWKIKKIAFWRPPRLVIACVDVQCPKCLFPSWYMLEGAFSHVNTRFTLNTTIYDAPGLNLHATSSKCAPIT